jgi:hypothetical protein
LARHDSKFDVRGNDFTSRKTLLESFDKLLRTNGNSLSDSQNPFVLRLSKHDSRTLLVGIEGKHETNR